MVHSSTSPHITNLNAVAPLLRLAEHTFGTEVVLWQDDEGHYASRCRDVLEGGEVVSEPGFLAAPLSEGVVYVASSERAWTHEDTESIKTLAGLLEPHLPQNNAGTTAYAEGLFQASPDCAKLLSLDGMLLAMNDNGCELMEIDDFSALQGQSWASLWPEPALPAAAVSQASREGEAHFQSYCPTAKGTPKWWDVSVKRVPHPDGEGDALLSVSRELSEPERGVDLAELLNSIDEGVLVFDEDWRVLYSNPKVAELLGFKVNEGLGAELASRVPTFWNGVKTLRELGEELELRYEPSQRWLSLRAHASAVGFTLLLRDVNSRYEAAEVQKLREAELRLALAANKMGVWNWDMVNDTVTTSVAFRSLWGFPEEPQKEAHDALPSQTIFARVHPEDLPVLQAAIEKSIRDDTTFDTEFRVQTDDGFCWLAGRGEVIKNVAGEPVRMLGVNFDVSERHKAKEIAEQQAAILSLAHDPMIVWNADEGITTWSRGAQDLYGYSEAESLGQETHTLLKTQHPVPVQEIMKVMRRDGEWRGVLVHTTKAGKQVTVETRHQLIDTQGGERVLEINHDVTEEHRLRAREHQLASIIEAAPSFIGIADAAGNATYVNPAGRGLLGLGKDSDEIEKLKIADFHPEASFKMLETEALPTAAKKGTWTGESDLKDNMGSSIPILQTIVAHKENGELAYFSTLGIDISRRKQVEAQLSELNHDLEKRVSERTAALERSNAELDQFTYVASHDLKAPLRAIDNLASWIAEDAANILPASSAKHLDTLRGRIRRMERLLEDLLAYSRVNRQTHRTENIVLKDLMTNVKRLAGVPESFGVSVDYGVQTVDTVRTPLETVLRNLLSNAVKHHPHQDGQIHVSFEDAGEALKVSVSDDGEGIASEFQERIFGIFQTLKARDTLEASGVGLAVVKKIVERRGGTVSVESEVGEGATFHVTWCKYAREDDL